MKNEVYYWAVLVAAILIVAVYVRYYYSPQLSVSLSFNSNMSSSLATVYPYQKLVLYFPVTNTGGAEIKDMGVGVLVDGNTTYVYGVTVPAGETANIIFNYTPTKGGTYNITLVADPDKLYSLADRSSAQTTIDVHVNDTETAEPYSLLPANGIIARGAEDYDISGVLLSQYLSDTYGIGALNFSKINGLDNFLVPVIYVSENAISKVDVAEGFYSNATVYSVWMIGYLTPQLIGVAADGRGFHVENYTSQGHTVTLVNLTDNETLCSWYAGGWVKAVAVESYNYSCMQELGQNGSFYLKTPINYTVNNYTSFNSSNVIAQYVRVYNDNESRGEMEFFQNVSLMYSDITNNAIANTLCDGIVSTADNTSYCSEYIPPVNNVGIGQVSMIGTRAFVDGYNLSALAIVNTSELTAQVGTDIAQIMSFNITGPSVSFVSGIKNTCDMGGNFDCTNATFADSTISVLLKNIAGKQITLTRIGCYSSGAIENYTALNVTLATNQSAVVGSLCTQNQTAITAVPLGLTLNLFLNYTENDTANSLTGNAFII